MSRVAFFAVDVLAIFCVGQVVYDAHGLAWAIVAQIAVAAYGCICYTDGTTR